MLAIAVVTPLSAFAQTPPPPAPAPVEAAPPAPPPAPMPPPPPPAPVVVETAPMAPVVPVVAATPAKTWKDLVTLDGLVDAYYMYNFTGPNSLSPGIGRQFDVNSNTFTLNYAKLGVGVSSDNVGFRADIVYVATAAIINTANPTDFVPDAVLVQQAYATVSPVNNLTIDFGKFVTTAGAEVIEANKNWLYSRSILFFNIPLLHTGLRLGYKVNDMLALQLSVVNGWNGAGIAPDVTADKTFGFNATITASPALAVYATAYVGKGEAGGTIAMPGSSTDTRFVGDLVVAYTAGALGLNLNFDYVNDQAAGIDGFVGVAAMGRYLVNEHFALAGRGEFVSVGPGAGGGDRINGQEVTVGLAFPMAGRFEFRAEGRFDHSSAQVFLNSDGMPSQSQFTGTGAFLSWF